MKAHRWQLSLSRSLIALSVLSAGAAFAASPAEKVMKGPTAMTPAVNAGQKGFWAEYTEYSYKYVPVLNQLQELYRRVFGEAGNLPVESFEVLANKIASGQMTFAQAEATVNLMKQMTDQSSSAPRSTDGPWNYGGKSVNFPAVEKLFGIAWKGQYGDKHEWLTTKYEHLVTDKPIYTVTSAPNTTSCFIEVSRLARLYEMVDSGYPLPNLRISGNFMAFYDYHPYSIPLTKEAILAKVREVYKWGVDTYSPIVLDLNHDGKIGVTGKSTAAVRNAKNTFVGEGSVLFDLRGAGRRERYEWLNGDGDGFLVYDRDELVSKAAREKGEIDGRKLFGNAVGYDHGYEKLAFFTAGIQTASMHLEQWPAGVLQRQAAKGGDLRDLKVWIDANRDALVQPEELRTLASLGITEVGLKPEAKKNQDDETLIVSYFVQNGQRHMAEDVWFAAEPPAKSGLKNK